jgi:hypothetical protein
MTHEFEIKAYVGRRLALHTWHTDRTSCWIEIQAYRERMRRGEISKIEVYDMEKMTVETIIP